MTNQPTQFCYLAADRQWESHQQWFNQVGFPDIPRYSLADDPDFDHKELLKPLNALDLFRRSLLKCNNGMPPLRGALVFVDPVSPLFIAGSPNNSRDVARTLLGMSKLAHLHQITLILVAHFSKQKNNPTDQYTRPQDRIAGSGAFSGFSDTQMYLVDPDKDHPFHTLGWTPRHQRPEEFACTRDEKTGLFIPYDVIQEDMAASQVLDCFDATGITTLAVVKDRVRTQHGYSDSTIMRALRQLLEHHRIVKLGRGKYARVKVH